MNTTTRMRTKTTYTPDPFLTEPTTPHYSDPLIPPPSLSRHAPVPPNRHPPSLTTLLRLHSSLITLAQTCYGTRHPTNRTSHMSIYSASSYSHLQRRIDIFFAQHVGHDFVADGSYGVCLEMKTLATCVEMRFGRLFGKTAYPEAMGMEEGELRELQRRVDRDVDRLLWGGGGVDLEVLGMRSRVRTPEGEDGADVSGDEVLEDGNKDDVNCIQVVSKGVKVEDEDGDGPEGAEATTGPAISPADTPQDDKSSAGPENEVYGVQVKLKDLKVVDDNAESASTTTSSSSSNTNPESVPTSESESEHGTKT